MRSILVICLLLMPLAGAQAEPTYPTTLYMYGDRGQDMVMNPVPPPADHRFQWSRGLATTSACVDMPLQTFTSGQHHTWYGYVVPNPPVLANGERMSTLYRGIGADVHLDEATGLRLHWFLATTGADGASTVVPRVVLEATVREGDDISVHHQAFNSGQRIAQDRTAPADLHPSIDHPQVTHHEVEGQDIYEFVLDLDIQGNATIPKEESFNVRLDVFVDNPLCQRPGPYAMPDLVEVHSSEGLRPRLELTLFEPVRIASLSATAEGGRLVFEARVVAAFGSGDVVLPAAGAFQISGPGSAVLGAMDWGMDHRTQQERVFVATGHDPAIVLRQHWNITDGSAEPGQYLVDLNLTTMSGAHAAAQVQFIIGNDEVVQTCHVAPPAEPDCVDLQDSSKKSPAPWLPLLMLALLVSRRLSPS